jgi:hypothetical protein
VSTPKLHVQVLLDASYTLDKVKVPVAPQVKQLLLANRITPETVLQAAQAPVDPTTVHL